MIREANNRDGEGIKAVVFGVLGEYGLKPAPQTTDADLDDIEGNYHRAGGAFYVIEEDGEIVGTVGVCPAGEGVCEIRKMYLKREWRGRGYGRLLLETAIAQASRMAARRVVLETASVLKEAVAMYTRYGFRQYQPDHAVASRCDIAMCLDVATQR